VNSAVPGGNEDSRIGGGVGWGETRGKKTGNNRYMCNPGTLAKPDPPPNPRGQGKKREEGLMGRPTIKPTERKKKQKSLPRVSPRGVKRKSHHNPF